MAGIDSDFATFVRTFVVLVGLGALLAATGKWRAAGQVSLASYGFLLLSGLATGASWLCYFRALQAGDAGRVASIDKLSVLLVAVFAAVFLGERLSVTNWFGIAFIATGALLVAHRG